MAGVVLRTPLCKKIKDALSTWGPASILATLCAVLITTHFLHGSLFQGIYFDDLLSTINIYAAVILVTAAALNGGFRSIKTLPLGFMLVTFGCLSWLLIGLCLAPYNGVHQVQVLMFVAFACFSWTLTFEDLGRFFQITSVAVIIAVAYCAFLPTDHVFLGPRARYIFDHQNRAAFLFSVCAAYFLFISSSATPVVRGALVCFFAFLTYTTQVRFGIFSFAGICGLFLIKTLRSKLTLKSLLLGMGIGAVALVTVTVLLTLMYRDNSFERLVTLNSRTYIWETYSQIIRAHPWTGVGAQIGRVTVFWESYDGRMHGWGVGHPHNFFVGLATTGGIPLLFFGSLFSLYWLYGLARLRNAWPTERLWCCVGIFGAWFIAANLTDAGLKPFIVFDFVLFAVLGAVVNGYQANLKVARSNGSMPTCSS